jgi:citrate lyase beta subunit
MIEAQIETARGFVNLREIAAAPALDALIFGPGDYAASLGAPLAQIGVPDAADAAYPGHRWHAVMHAIVAHARAFGLRCSDGPFAAYRDEDGLKQSAMVARALGFDGKQCIHPAQLATVNTIFRPTADELAHARALLAQYAAAEAAGAGAAGVDGVMIDAANLRMARATLARER